MRWPVRRAPYVTRWGFVIPLASLVVSLTSLLIVLAITASASYHALTGREVNTPLIRLSNIEFATLVCLVTLGPAFSVLLCLTQRARVEQVFGSDIYLGYQIKRLNSIGLVCGALALGAAMLGLLLLTAAG